MKNYLKCYLYLWGIILGLTIIYTIVNYFFGYLGDTIKLLIPVLGMFISSILLGRQVKQKAYLEGLKFAGEYLVVAIVVGLITRVGFSVRMVIGYGLILIAGIIGAMIGINTNKK